MEMQDYLMWAGKAAQAGGVPIVFHLDHWSRTYKTDRDGNEYLRAWEPHKRPDEAFELAVTLGLSIDPYPIYGEQKHSVIVTRRLLGDMVREENPYHFAMPYNGNPMGATCMAIIAVAAEVGKRL